MLSVRVSPGMLPPTISTTPNSPSVCAAVRATPPSRPGHASGNSIRAKVRQLPSPDTQAASRSELGMDAKARWMGCAMKGRLTSTLANSRPSKLNTSLRSRWPASQAPAGEPWPSASSR